MATVNSQIELKVLGQKLVLKSDADPERSRRVVEWVTQRVAVIEKRLGAARKGSTIPPMHIALLALLEIGQEYLDAKERMEKHQAEMNQIANTLMLEIQKKTPLDVKDQSKEVSMATGLRIQKPNPSVKKKSRR